jgi:L-ascorbate metabolism protein UlaG (beta-lactamase superfamily)
MGAARGRDGRFLNSDADVVIGNFPWYEMVWRSLRGDFKPLKPPEDGYESFARKWSVAVDHGLLATRSVVPRVTWLGHVTVLLQVANLNILFDPTLCAYAGPNGKMGAPRRVPPPLAAEELPPLDLVLVSHNHYDHLDYDTLSRLHAAGQRPRYLVPIGLGEELRRWGLDDVFEMDWWQRLEHGPLTLHFTPAQHWSRRTPFDTNRSLWGGFCIEWQRDAARPWRYFFPGDTGYSADFKRIRERIGAMDFVALPIGAYLPRDFMKPMHINPEEALQLLEDVGGRQAMGVHWGTFELTQEAFDQPPRDLETALRQRPQEVPVGRRLSSDRVWLLKHGETRTITLPA